ncbi:hypothetical protein [Pontibacter burrus]|uniref:Glycosyltransferase RgtA/B/C/D-like domain-containing protein n=1 Tax=Pontibacter burrus TaxID=2704466 RepID=A0A6B3M0T2_9BACT|nr:hypothetical protein [Pontibacter burrus]NEM99550.1 hypothetical protein [Pontibacter burrus]
MHQYFVSLNQEIQKVPGYLIFCGLAILWLIVQFYFLQSLGVRTVPDSTFRYIPYATQIAETWQLGESHDNRYFLYIAFLALFVKSDGGLTISIIVQTALSGAACILFYKAVKHLTDQSRLPAILATIIFILWKDIQYLNVYILTESLFISALVLVFYALVKSRSWKDYLVVIALCVIPALLRPNGFIVLLSVLVCFGLHYRQLLFRYRKLVIGSAVAGVIILIAILDRYLLTTFEIVETYARGEVIYASNIFAVPADGVTLPTEKDSPLLRILYFILQNPVFFFKLFFAKLIVFIAYIKPYYSLLHNLSIVFVIHPLYFFTVWLFLKDKKTAARAFAPTVFILQACIVAATSEDWDSRFITLLLPVIIASGVAGVYSFVKHKLR